MLHGTYYRETFQKYSGDELKTIFFQFLLRVKTLDTGFSSKYLSFLIKEAMHARQNYTIDRNSMFLNVIKTFAFLVLPLSSTGEQ